MAYPIDDLQKFAESWLAMGDSHTDRQIGETMAEVLRERLMELETQEATGAATEDTSAGLLLCASC